MYKSQPIDEFIGGGKLRVARNSSLTINETAEGETKLLVGGFGDTSEYISELPTQTLITTPVGSNANFTLLPNASQTDEVIISNQNNNEWKVVSTKVKPEITEYNSITFDPNVEDYNDSMTFKDDHTMGMDFIVNLYFTIDPMPTDSDELDKFINLVDLYINDKKITKTTVIDQYGQKQTGWKYKAIDFIIGDTAEGVLALDGTAEILNDDPTIDNIFNYTYERDNKIKLEVVQDGNTVTSNEADLIINDERNLTNKVDVTGITINESEINLNLDNYETKTIEYTIEPADATNKGVKFESSDTSILEVGANGELIPKNKGTATVTITSEGTPSVSVQVEINISNTEPVQA
ncbi:MAG: Ig-like domain-containing protein, partial [Eubacteriales bacterium]|nr:Ig-like domain-containing protein [Eubacteriales bacterium]